MILRLLALFLYWLLTAVTAYAAVFSVQGRLIHRGDPSVLAEVPIVVLKKDDQQAGAIFPVARSSTDQAGNFIFSELDFPLGSEFQLGVLVAEQRVGSAFFSYRGEDVNFDFDLTDIINITPTGGDFTVRGQLIGDRASLDQASTVVYLEEYLIDDQGEIQSEIIAQTVVDSDWSYELNGVALSARTSFKLGVMYHNLFVRSPLFFVSNQQPVQNILLPAITTEVEKLHILRDTAIYRLQDDHVRVSQFININNDSPNIVTGSAIFEKTLPARAANFDVPDDPSKEIDFAAQKLAVGGSFLPGDNLVYLEYQLPFSYSSSSLGFFAGAAVTEFIYRDAELNLQLSGLPTIKNPVNIGADANFSSLQVRNSALSGPVTQAQLRIIAKFWPLAVYLWFGCGMLILLLGLAFFGWRRMRLKA